MRIFALVLLLPTAVPAAVLHASGTLNGPLVRISDLWEDAGPQAGRALGPAPAPGGRIVVGAAQLAAIARSFGVDWQPQSEFDQAVLDRPGAPLAIQSVLDVLRPSLIANGAGAGDASFDIALPFFDPPTLDAGAAPHLSVEQISFDPASGRFAAVVVVGSPGTEALRLRLAGSVAASVAVLVPTRRLLPGAIIGATDLMVQRIRASLVSAAVVQEPSQAVGLTVRHVAFAGQPLPIAELAHPICITKGDRVMMALTLPGLELGAVGQALQDGAVGDRIAVRNPVSGALLTGAVTGPDQVRIDPDAAVASNQSSFTLAAR